MDNFFCFRKQTTYSKYQKVKNYRKLPDLFDLKNKFLNTASGIVLLPLFKCFSSLFSLHYPFIETDQQAPHLLLSLIAKKGLFVFKRKATRYFLTFFHYIFL